MSLRIWRLPVVFDYRQLNYRLLIDRFLQSLLRRRTATAAARRRTACSGGTTARGECGGADWAATYTSSRPVEN